MRDAMKTALKAAVSLSVLLFVILSAGPGQIWDVVSTVDAVFFVGALALATAGIFVSAGKLQLLLRAKGQDVSYLTVLRYYYIGTFFNSVLPSTIGGDVVKAYRLFDDTDDRGEAVAAVFMDRYTGLVALLSIAVVAAAVAPVALPRQVMLAVYGTAAAAVLLTLLLAWKPVDRFVPRRVPGVVEKVVDQLRNVQDAVTSYRRRPGAVAVALGISLGFHVFLATVNIVLARAVDMAVPWPYFFVFIPIAAVILFLPISIGGLGVREAVYTYLFTLAGATAAEAVAVSLLFQGIFLFGASVGGIVYGLEGYGG